MTTDEIKTFQCLALSASCVRCAHNFAGRAPITMRLGLECVPAGAAHRWLTARQKREKSDGKEANCNNELPGIITTLNRHCRTLRTRNLCHRCLPNMKNGCETPKPHSDRYVGREHPSTQKIRFTRPAPHSCPVGSSDLPVVQKRQPRLRIRSMLYNRCSGRRELPHQRLTHLPEILLPQEFIAHHRLRGEGQMNQMKVGACVFSVAGLEVRDGARKRGVESR